MEISQYHSKCRFFADNDRYKKLLNIEKDNQIWLSFVICRQICLKKCRQFAGRTADLALVDDISELLTGSKDK